MAIDIFLKLEGVTREPKTKRTPKKSTYAFWVMEQWVMLAV